ncbi:hypothetical protein L873DRAFT_1433420 [Choiromyces venosus 120613-1]|uniref:Uncharacterized protein n=1 Tax=Choiromyces venosus 120613-1 TaxID=1336337 RepID=A0A3N4J801_9PEZI|nr:hypothetical protein L873DRAFT_1433420 [Choiromyces venosus 120613-1]
MQYSSHSFLRLSSLVFRSVCYTLFFDCHSMFLFLYINSGSPLPSPIGNQALHSFYLSPSQKSFIRSKPLEHWHSIIRSRIYNTAATCENSAIFRQRYVVPVFFQRFHFQKHCHSRAVQYLAR